MWPYATRGSRFLGDISEISPSALESEDFSTNAVSIKLFLSARLKLELQDLADAAKQPLSSDQPRDRARRCTPNCASGWRVASATKWRSSSRKASSSAATDATSPGQEYDRACRCKNGQSLPYRFVHSNQRLIWRHF